MDSIPEPKTITIYVRRGSSDNERVLSFHRIPEISAKEALETGLAIDGNSFALSVGQSDPGEWGDRRRPEYNHALPERPFSGPYFSVVDALNSAEAALVEMLDKHGYEVDFK